MWKIFFVLLIGERMITVNGIGDMRFGREEFLKKDEIANPDKKQLKKYNTKKAIDHFQPFLKEALMHEFKARVTVDRGAIDCFFEECDAKSTIVYASFGSETAPSFSSDGNLKGYFRRVNGSRYPEKKRSVFMGSLKLKCGETGWVQFCLDNSEDKIREKVVDFQLIVLRTSMLMGYHLKQKFLTDNDENIVYRLYDDLYQVARGITTSKLALRANKVLITRDMNMSFSNAWMVKYFSILAIMIMVLISFGQVYCLKKMFVC